MVARFISGKSIKGALRYNEEKVKKGKAVCIAANGYPVEKGQLTFSQKAARLENLAALNERVKVNCVHVSLNFDPSEILSEKKLRQIADAYINKIGFDGQPYLVYRHFDAAHPHIHIVTTNIRPDGKRIALHNIGRNQSEEARKEIEIKFGLIPAESRKKSNEIYLKRIPAEKAVYGKSETKAAISNVVREVIRAWKFTSLAQYNAILREYNVIANNGMEGSRMREKNGLVYSILDEQGNEIGVPIKASSIYTKPTWAKLKNVFEQNKEQRKPYRFRVKNCIDKAINSDKVTTRTELKEALSKEGILVIFRENEAGRTYGITFLDKKAKVVFNGSELGKAYSSANILKRIHSDNNNINNDQEPQKRYMAEVLKATNFRKGFASVLAQLSANGILIIRKESEENGVAFFLKNKNDTEASLIPAGKKLSAYLLANGYSNHLESKLQSYHSNTLDILPTMKMLENWIAGLLKSEAEYGNYPMNRKKKKRKHKPNW